MVFKPIFQMVIRNFQKKKFLNVILNSWNRKKLNWLNYGMKDVPNVIEADNRTCGVGNYPGVRVM